MLNGVKAMKSLQISSTLKKTKVKPRKYQVFLSLIIILIIITFLSLFLGAEKLNVVKAFSDIINHIPSKDARILKYVRLPRTLAGLLAGAALASAGVIIQSVLSNPLAAPSTIGVNAGAGLTVAIFCALAPSALSWVPIAAQVGAFIGVAIVLSISEHTSASKITLVLAGVAVSGIFNAGIDAVVTFVPDALNGYSDFRIGGLSGVSMKQLSPAVYIIIIGLIIALSLHNEMDILMLGTEQAQSLGLPAKKLRVIFLALAALLAGSAVSFCGLIGFVGLLVPHMMRQLIEEESGPLILGSALGGAALLCGCDLLSRLIFAPYELPVGVVMSLAGGPFFLFLLRKKGVHNRYD